jgi:MFS superfamily sulfate permease-like transporter
VSILSIAVMVYCLKYARKIPGTILVTTGLGALRDLADTLHDSGRSLLLCGAREQPSQLMKQAEFERHVGAENICGSITEALRRAGEVYRRHYSNKAASELPVGK